MIYYDESRKLRLYLNDRYGFAESSSSVDAFKGKSGILFAEYSENNNGVMGLWDGTKVNHMDDFTNIESEFYFWPSVKGESFQSYVQAFTTSLNTLYRL